MKKEEIEVLSEEEEIKKVKDEELIPVKRSINALLYLIVMILFGLILIKTLNIKVVDYGIKDKSIVYCEKTALQFNYQKSNKHWIGLLAISLGMAISYLNIWLSLNNKMKKVLSYIAIVIATISIIPTIYLIVNDIKYENSIQTNDNNIEINCKKK